MFVTKGAAKTTGAEVCSTALTEVPQRNNL